MSKNRKKIITFCSFEQKVEKKLKMNVVIKKSIIYREQYLNRLISLKDKKIIKVLTGIRRAGKSTILQEFKEYLLQNGVDKKTYYLLILMIKAIDIYLIQINYMIIIYLT